MSSWVPAPVGVVWATLFGLVVIVHVGHAVVMHGRHRRWHVGHVLMAVGMMVMFLPTHEMLVPAAVGVWVFGVAAAGLALLLGAARLSGSVLGPLWLVSVVDLIAMAYMYAMMTAGVSWVSVLAAVWFGAQALGWATGWLGGVLERRGLGDPVPPSHAVVAAVTAPADEPTPGPSRDAPEEDAGERDGTDSTSALLVAVRTRVTAVRERVVDGGRRDWSVRVSLAVMSVGMAYMLLAMQFGMAGGSPMPSMPGMAGGM